MKLDFICGGILEYTGTYRQMSGIEGVNIENLDLNNKTLRVSGISSKNYDEVCTKLQEIGWRKLNI